MAVDRCCHCEATPTMSGTEVAIANKAIVQSRHDFYSRRISDAGSDPRKRWSVIRDTLHQAERQETNSTVNSQARRKSFADYFTSKIENIKSIILQQLNGCVSDATVSDAVFTSEQFTS